MNSKITVILIIGLVAGSGLGYFISFNTYMPQIYELETSLIDTNGELEQKRSQILILEEKILDAENKLSDAEESIVKLQNKISNIEEIKESLESQLTYQINEVNHLNSELTTCRHESVSLLTEIYYLEDEIEFLESIRIGTTLETYYDYVRANVVELGGYPRGEEEWWRYPDYYEDSVWLASCMAAHDAGNLYWPSLDTEYNDTVGEPSSHTAHYILTDFIYKCSIFPDDPIQFRINRILEFVNSFVTYETRLVDHMWFPTETLTFRSGDCTSYSILVASLFEMVEIKSAMGFFLNDQGEAHAMVLINYENLPDYETWYFDDLTEHGLSSGRWIIIEPQYSSLAEQENYQDEWIEQWNLKSASEVKYGP